MTSAAPLGWRPLLSLFVGFAALSLALLRPALDGPPVSDDFAYIIYNPYLAELSLENVLAILDPWGAPAANTVNYAPLHLLGHAVEVQLFGGELAAWRVVNVLLHALGATLLVALLVRTGVPAPFALLGGAWFTVHPANVEAVAWLFQLKTCAGLVFALGALLAVPRRPLLGCALFACALLTKALAAFVLPMAAARVWCRPPAERRWWPVAAWALLFALYAIPELAAFRYAVAVDVPAYDDTWVQARTIAAIGMRYLVMAASGWGTSAFHETPPVLSPLDPWFLAALPAGALLAWRAVHTLVRRSEESLWWIGAAAAFAPVSQVFPFLYPMGDRYLYYILPGLIGGALLAARGPARRLSAAAATRAPALRPWLGRTALAAGVLLAVAFALQAAQRAPLWRSEVALFEDSARHYPDGATAHFLSALRHLSYGDKPGAIASLREAVDRGYDRGLDLARDARLEKLHGQPEFEVLLREVAGRRIALGRERGYASQTWLHLMAEAHLTREEYDEAEALLERALATEGPIPEKRLRRQLEEVRQLAP